MSFTGSPPREQIHAQLLWLLREKPFHFCLCTAFWILLLSWDDFRQHHPSISAGSIFIFLFDSRLHQLTWLSILTRSRWSLPCFLSQIRLRFCFVSDRICCQLIQQGFVDLGTIISVSKNSKSQNLGSIKEHSPGREDGSKPSRWNLSSSADTTLISHIKTWTFSYTTFVHACLSFYIHALYTHCWFHLHWPPQHLRACFVYTQLPFYQVQNFLCHEKDTTS